MSGAESGNGLMEIGRIVVGQRCRKDLGDLGALARSIREVGLLHPIVISPEGVLVAGQRRLEACRLLGWEQVPVRVVDLQDLLRAEHDENTVRKDFLPSEAVAIARALEPLERQRARERHVAQAKVNLGLSDAGNLPSSGEAESGERAGGGSLPPPMSPSDGGKLPPSGKGKTRDKLARCVGMSGRTLEKARAVVEAAEKEPEVYGPLVEKMDRTGRVNGAYKLLQRAKLAEDIRQEPPPLPDEPGKYRVIVADPPWRYDVRAEDLSQQGNLP